MMGTLPGVLGGVGVVVLLGAMVAAAMLGRASASVRHLVWTMALGVLVLVPLIHVSGLRVEVPVPAGWVSVGAPVAPVAPSVSSVEPFPAVPSTPGVEPLPAERAPVPAPVADPPGRRSSAVGQGSVGAPSVPRDAMAALGDGAPSAPLDAMAALGDGEPAGAAATREPVESRTEVVPMRELGSSAAGTDTSAAGFDWLAGLVFLWLGGSVALIVTILSSHVAAARLTRRGAYRASPTVSRRFAILSEELSVRPLPRLVVSPSVRVPATWGMRRHTIVLPEEYEGWSRETLDRVLLHELAHVVRRDCLTCLVGEVARAVYWPNPLAWFALRRQRVESERACDDLVLARGVAASDYADDLLRLVRSLGSGRALPQAAVAMARPSGLAQRVRAVLDPTQSRRRVGRRMARATGGLVGVLAFGLTALVPVAATQEAPPRAVEVTPVGAPSAAASVIPPDPSARMVALPPVGAPARAGEEVSIAPGPTWAIPTLPEWSASSSSQEHCVFAADGRRSTSHSSDDGSVRIRWETDDCRVDVDIEGDIEYAADDSGIIGMDRDALFEIEERVGRDVRRARFVGTRDGIERRYWVDGDEVAWGADADAWMAGILPELFRHTTINAQPRVRRMLAEGGTDRVFEEVELLHSDHVTGTYLELLLEETELREAEYVRVIDFAGEMESDHASGELLLGVVARAGLRPAFQDPLLRAAEGIESDHQKSRVLQVILESDLTPAQIDAVVRSASTIESDHNLAMVLSAVATSGRLNDLGRDDFLDALATIESDHNHGVVLGAFLDVGPLSPAELTRVLEMTEGIDSDHERGMLLRRVGSEYALTGDQATAYLRSASALASDHELGMTAQALTERRTLSEAQVDLAFGIARQIASDHSRATTLQTIVIQQDLTDSGALTYLDVARGIASDHQLATTLTILIEDMRLRPDGVEALLETAGGIDSSHQLGSVLMAVAERYSLDGDALRQYERLADRLGRSDRERALGALRR